MPNMYEQLHPWERANVTLGSWRRLWDRVAREHIAADHALRQFFATGGSITRERLNEMREASQRWQRAWWDVFEGNEKVVRELMHQWAIDPSDSHVGPE